MFVFCMCTVCVLVYVLYVYLCMYCMCTVFAVLSYCSVINSSTGQRYHLGCLGCQDHQTSFQRQENEALTDFQIVKGFQIGQHVVRAAVSPTAKHGQKTPNAARCPQWLPGRLARGPVGSKRGTTPSPPAK